MARRTARKGAETGSQFWGCTGYPECRGPSVWPRRPNRTEPTDPSNRSDGMNHDRLDTVRR
jgi:ssDNA-binding Zn-finger/Zn-ribbon topoisomerase 1